jgi:hypothetical protein
VIKVEKTITFNGKKIPNRLTIVPGHAILYYGLDGIRDPVQESSWYLQPFQRGEQLLYIQHIEAGVERSSKDSSLLVFSGPSGRPGMGPRTEGQSYWFVADFYDWFGHQEVEHRAAVEELSHGASLENITGGICRFHELTGEYPDHITVMGFEFKAERFDMHRAAISFPRERFEYVGVNNPPKIEAALRGEENTRSQFREDPYGKINPVLVQKTEERNPDKVYNGYQISCPEVAGLLRHRGPEIYGGSLPWTTSITNHK